MNKTMKIITGENIALGLAMTLLGIFGFPRLLPYGWHVFLHVLGAVLFIGNIIVSGVWMTFAERMGKKDALSFSATMLNWADVVFTGPGIFLLLTNGFIIAYATWSGLKYSWIIVSLGLFVLSGLIWMIFLLPQQNRMEEITLNATGDELPDAFYQTLRRWSVWGMISTILPLVSLGLMVFKPQLW